MSARIALRHKDILPIVGNKGLTTGILKGRRNISVAIAKRLARCPACAR